MSENDACTDGSERIRSRIPEGYNRYTDKQLLYAIQQVTGNLIVRYPSAKDYERHRPSHYPTIDTIKNRFGTYTKAREMALGFGICEFCGQETQRVEIWDGPDTEYLCEGCDERGRGLK